MQAMQPISAVIIALNEADSIARAIGSLGCADEIVVVDSGSTDGTRDIAEGLGARVIHHEWTGYAAQKNFAVAQARYDWILSLDADEELDAAAQAAVRDWKASDPARKVAGYRIARRARFLGRWIRHSGWYPDYKIRLFDRRRGRWQGDFVHESVHVTGRVETMAGEILHRTCDSLDDFEKRIERYAELGAREMLQRRERPGALLRFLAPPWRFLHTYFVRLGFLDGYPGFLIAQMEARYVRQKFSRLAQLREAAGEH